MKVAIIEDHPLMADSLKNILAEDTSIEVTGVHADGRSFLSSLPDNCPDVILLDYHLPDMTGAQLCRQVRSYTEQTKILVLTGFEKPGLITEMLESGCSGYLLKGSTDGTTLIQTLIRISEGEIYLDPNISKMYAKQLSNRQVVSVETRLTIREREILKEIVGGLSSKEISEKLFISKRTVDNHRNSIMAKTGSRNLAGLIQFAQNSNLTS